MSLQLIITLLDHYSPLLNLILLKYYPYNAIHSLLTELRDSKDHYQIRILASELIAALHEKYFNMTLNAIPLHIQILKDEGKID